MARRCLEYMEELVGWVLSEAEDPEEAEGESA
jgi:hypothetical protein